ncbi:MAG: TolC family protein [candidate division Zixibacteria bacterium]|nr:TolC family protein [candidate division Zixibacteria bacterium]
MTRRQLSVALVISLSLLTVSARPAAAETLTLDQCVDIALRQNATILTPGLKTGMTSAREGVWTAWGGILPSLSGGVDYDWSKTNRHVAISQDSINGGADTSITGGSSSGWRANLGIRQTLFDGLANYYTIRESRQSLIGYRQQYRSAELSLILQVKQSYYDVLRAKGLLIVDSGAVERSKKDLETIQSMFDLGSKSRSDLLKAKVRLGTAQVSLISRLNAYGVAIAALNNILNRDVSTPFELADVGAAPDLGLSYDQALKEAKDNSPLLLAARAEVEAKRSSLGIARAAYFPDLSWNAGRSYSAAERKDLFKSDNGTWGIGLSLSYTIFDGFVKKSNYSRASVSLKTTREGLTQEENNVALAVRQAFLSWQLAHDKMALADETEKSAQEDFNLAQEKYNLGAGTILELLDAQVSLTQAQTDKVNALYDYHLAVAALENSMGRGR